MLVNFACGLSIRADAATIAVTYNFAGDAVGTPVISGSIETFDHFSTGSVFSSNPSLVAKALLAYYIPGTSVNQTPSNYFGQPRTTLNDDQFSVRADYAVTHYQTTVHPSMMEPSRCSLLTYRNLVSTGASRDDEVCIDHIDCSEEPKVQLSLSGYVAMPLREAHPTPDTVNRR